MKPVFTLLVGVFFCIVGCSAVWAQKEVAPMAAPHPWQALRVSGQSEAYFTNLVDGASIETPFVLKLGLSGNWGLAPIAVPVQGKSGHHHLLINRDLPLDFKKPLPFNEQYIHFGKGQMETVLDLAPGNYTLRLLLADEQHLPHFVYSKPMKITVTKKKGVDKNTAAPALIELLNVTPEAKLGIPFRLQFHASGFQIAHLVQKIKDTGHFQLRFTPRAGGKTVEMNFANGQTEVWVQPPAGAYSVKLMLLDNVQVGKVLAESFSKDFVVSN